MKTKTYYKCSNKTKKLNKIIKLINEKNNGIRHTLDPR